MSAIAAGEAPDGPDFLRPFQIEASDVRGRFVRLGPALDAILGAHPYPRPVAALLAEAVGLAALLAGMLKYDGIFTLQAQGEGPVDLLVCDATSAGGLRGFARWKADAPALAPLNDPAAAARRDADIARATVTQLLGRGRMAFTVDQGAHSQRYQGVVALEGETLTACAHHYFRQSEQLQARFAVAVGEELAPGGVRRWRLGGAALQKLPAEDAAPEDGPGEDEGFRRAALLLDTVTPAELLDPDLSDRDLLFRLFHEDGVRVWPTAILSHKCRCSRDRVLTALQGLGADDRAALAEDPVVEATCEFCNTRYRFEPSEIAVSGSS